MNRDDPGHIDNESILDRFIDDLALEKKPEAYQSGPVDPEMEKMFETVRAIRRLRGGRRRKKTGSRRRVGGLAAIAAALLLAVVGLNMLPGLNLPWPWMGRPGIVEAAVKAYEELHGYSGVFEIRDERDGVVRSLETVTIQYQKPRRYAAVHSFNGYELRYTSDGEKMIAYEYGAVTVENLFPEKELWRYHIGTVVRELSGAEKVEMMGTETIFGREAELLRYFYPGSGPGEYGQVWIDSATWLPLRKELFHPDGSVLVVEFRELAVNPHIDPAVFEWTLPEDRDVVELNRPCNLDRVIEAWPDVGNILPPVYSEMKFERAGVLDYDLFDYVLRFRGEAEWDFLDIYYTGVPREFAYERHSKFGLLGDGYVELNPGAWNVFERYHGSSRAARWVTEEFEVFMVSSRGIDFLQLLLEKLAQHEIRFKTLHEMKEHGLEPVTEKEGH